MEFILTKKSRLPLAVSTITPQRISFFGGGTDIPSFYKFKDGEVISSAINQYVYVTIKRHSPLFKEQYRLSYSITEHVNSLEAIENSIARECLRLVPINPPLYISTAADLPASSGLGSSSSFAVGLLNALHLMRGERVSPAQLAEEACRIEIDILGNPIGKQDQYAAAFGGLNHFVFKSNGRVEIDHLVLEENLIETIFENSLLIWSETQRSASAILSKQAKKIEKKSKDYQSLIDHVRACKLLLLNSSKFSMKKFGSLLEESWQIKKGLERSITNKNINSTHEKIIKIGGFGGKLSGAGGGGFLYEIIPKEKHNALFNSFGNKKLINISFEPLGSRILYELF